MDARNGDCFNRRHAKIDDIEDRCIEALMITLPPGAPATSTGLPSFSSMVATMPLRPMSAR
jgi:hypothetical protein